MTTNETTTLGTRDCTCACGECLAGEHEACSERTPCELCSRVEEIEVVAGVIVRRDRLLLTQRPDGPTALFPNAWECPGGKLDPERHAEERAEHAMRYGSALKRELREELGIEAHMVRIEPPIWQGDFEVYRPGRRKPWRRIHMTFLEVVFSWTAGSMRPREGQGIGWFRREEVHALLLAMDLTPGNAKAHEAILEHAFGRRA